MSTWPLNIPTGVNIVPYLSGFANVGTITLPFNSAYFNSGFYQRLLGSVISGTVLSGISISMPISGLITQGPFNTLAGAPTGVQLGNFLSQEGYFNLFGSLGVSATQATAVIDLENRGSGQFNYPELSLIRSRSTFPSVSGILSGDNMGHLGFWAAQDSAGTYANPSYIDSIATENISAVRQGSALRFWVTESGSNTQIEKFELNASGLGFLGKSTSTIGNIYTNNLYSTVVSGLTFSGVNYNVSQNINPVQSGNSSLGSQSFYYSGVYGPTYQNVTKTASNYTASLLDTNIFTYQSASIQINLPAANPGKEYIIISTVTAAVNNVVISGVGNVKIDGGFTKTINSATPGASSYLLSDGSGYYSLSNLV